MALTRYIKNTWGMFSQLSKKNVYFVADAGAPVDGVVGTGTGATFMGIGALYIDTTNGNLYINAGTLASPVWKLVTRAA